ncbi:pantetheine-phosphate adenylyltransferase [Lapidilactobacillus dextrinicus DSM 20335]|uniref:Phosphopantetheine adenylyltransferase n=1 Tax=Lapidilactobacillus dextrinicus DSM 20335 TaxID=1423738 RepID=A0A0R2BFQ6_9LACO|nr:pantetheine-phosphate adenylyltransferase [Lapidilactobacillus dextrinicus]KRM78463.1 pantetheine-phosphate adenylyltransferase [Lapidilactobacillus dextrinicus DSM 20335]QFG47262.1 pantetheine-phosphate adenylyltransferase [Lapidilactobacillus dextrinicus]
MSKVALFAGSFDPFTKGHLQILKKALAVFDEVVVAIMTNDSKHYLLNTDEKIQVVKEAVASLAGVRVIARPATLTTDLARQVGAQFLVRGLRNSADLEYETGIAQMNQTLAPEIQTVFLLADQDNSFVSSSMIKEVLVFGGDVSAFLTPTAIEILSRKLKD